MTAVRSRVNYPRFLREFPECVDSGFTQYYAIGRRFSKVSARQYLRFMQSVGARIEIAPQSIRDLFDFNFIEEVFLTEECAFNPVVLKEAMVARVRDAGGELRLRTEARRIAPAGDERLAVTLHDPDGEREILAKHVFNCTYSQINALARNSGLPLVPLKHELTEMALLEVPDEFKHIGVTVMCGPFFSTMPFPPEKMHTLSHVRYTPHFYWMDAQAADYVDAHALFKRAEKSTAFPHMLRDAARYLPILAQGRYRGSLWEVKTVLPLSETDDSRPILFKRHCGLRNYHVIMGGKIDNVYDVAAELQELFEKGELR